MWLRKVSKQASKQKQKTSFGDDMEKLESLSIAEGSETMQILCKTLQKGFEKN